MEDMKAKKEPEPEREHAIDRDGVIDMHGIGLVAPPAPVRYPDGEVRNS